MEALAGVLVIGAAAGANKVWNSRKDGGNLAKDGYDTIKRQALLSMLVHWAYFRDLKLVEKGAAWLADYNNKRANDYGKQHWESYPCSASMSCLQDLGLAFLRRERSHNNPNAPGLAIVLRGTIPSRRLDLLADLRIGVQRLNESDRVVHTVRLILEVVVKFRKENPDERICMAGHSLGAAVALIVGGTLFSTHDIDIDTHLFNPPLVTVVDVVTGRAFPRRTAPPAHFDGVDHVAELDVNFAELKQVFGNKAAIDGEWAQFQKLRDWTPHFYLNRGDPFCHRPVETPGDVMSTQGLLSSLFKRDARYFKNVVPCAHVYTSTWEDKSLRLAHSLRQWHKYDPKHIGLEYHRIDLFN